MKLKLVAVLTMLFLIDNCFAGNAHINNVKIKMIRAVGDYAGDTYDNTIEIWPTEPISWPSSVSCTSTFRVYVNAQHTHLVSAAYMALATNKTISIHVDDQLPKRDGSCEVSYIDVFP